MNNKWLRKTIQNFTPYTVPAIQESIILNANESPYNILDFPEVRADFLEGLSKLPSYRYPDPLAEELRGALANYVGVESNQILATNGGDELITLIMNTFLDADDTVLISVPTFDVYAGNAAILGAKVLAVPSTEDFQCDQQRFLETLRKEQPKVTVLCNPNNPTGELLPLSFLQQVLEIAENPVVIDEAYIEFSGQESIIPLLKDYPNLIVLRTLSKAFGLAGYRLGYGVASPSMISALTLTKLYYNLNSVTQLMGTVVMKYSQLILEHNVPPTLEARNFLMQELNKLEAVTVYPSATNFILVRMPNSEEIIQALHKADICVRYYKTEDLKNCLRITATTLEVAQKVIAVFQEVCSHA